MSEIEVRLLGPLENRQGVVVLAVIAVITAPGEDFLADPRPPTPTSTTPAV